MPDMGSLSISASLTLSHSPNLKSVADPSEFANSLFTVPVKALGESCVSEKTIDFPVENRLEVDNGNGLRVFRRRRRRSSLGRLKKACNGRCVGDDVGTSFDKKIDPGVSRLRSSLPFLFSTPKMVECLVCHHSVHPGEQLLCTVRGCKGVYHIKCAKDVTDDSYPGKFKCPQHACFLCKQKPRWRCVRCPVASHDKCSPWPHVMHREDLPGRAVCWRHPTDWRLDGQSEASTSDIEEIFCRLPLPYVDKEFKIDFAWKNMETKMEPPPYVHIRRNIYLTKKKRSDIDVDSGCTNCSSVCSHYCVCRVQCISCSKTCRCSENCTNRPFHKEKKIKVVKTELCGWGVEAAESINKGEFIVEYLGEVIDDAQCEQRLWDMKDRGVKNFYMCEIRKDFTIDATFKGNSSRFLNHSCDPNCFLEKWQVEGETRVGVFAARSIKGGEPLTYDYRFVQFGPEVKCHCGASNCQGFLGTKRKIGKIDISWGSKRKRTSAAVIAILTV